jgi:hypothetical protein
MRFSMTSVLLLMVFILLTAVAFVKGVRRSFEPKGHSLALVLLKSADAESLQEVFRNGSVPLLGDLQKKGVSFQSCHASSPWYPSSLASLLTGLYPSEHGLNRSHAHLPAEVETLAEKLNRGAFRTFATVGRNSLLKPLNVLQGFDEIEEVDARETVPSLFRFLDRCPSHHNFFVLLEIDVDALGGPRSLDAVLEILYEGIGGDLFLEKGMLILAALQTPWSDRSKGWEDYSTQVSLLMAGSPMMLGLGKHLLKPVSICELEGVLWDLALGQGFNLRDAVRKGQPVVTEAVEDLNAGSKAETVQPVPRYYRSLFFDDKPHRVLVEPSGKSWVLDPGGQEMALDAEPAGTLMQRHEDFLAQRTLIPDRNIPMDAGCVLDKNLMALLGRPWNRKEFEGRALHAVEHFRLAEALMNSGYQALAVGELNAALNMDHAFPAALFLLAQVYATLDPEGARKHYQAFLTQYGSDPAHQAMADRAREFLARH